LLRSPLILGAPAAGLLVGALFWLLFAHGAAASARIADMAARAEALNAPDAASSSANAGSLAASSPIFALTTGPGAVHDIEVLLTGIARTPTHNAALVSINGKAAEWIDQGQTKDDVTLNEVDVDKIIVDTPTGAKDVLLGQKPATSQGVPPASGGPVGPPADHGPPAGFHLPPPPASAPGA
jgi:hypothetical protein